MEGGGLRCYFGFDFDLGAFSIGLIGHQLMVSLHVFGLSFAVHVAYFCTVSFALVPWPRLAVRFVLRGPVCSA